MNQSDNIDIRDEGRVRPVHLNELMNCDLQGRPTSLAGRLEHFFQAGLGSYSLGNIGSDLVNFANACKTECKFPHSKVQFSGDIFPLPDSYEKLKSLLSHVSPQALAWTQAMTVGLNSYCGVSDPGEGAVSSAGMLALQSLSKHAEQIAEWSEKFEDVSWESFLKVKSVNYMGDEVRVAHSFQWEHVKSALPSEIGHIQLEDVCSGGILDYVQRFESYLLPEDARVYTKPPRVMVEDAHWMGVCKGLVQSGVCEILPLDEVFCVNSRPILNGLFGVSKNEFDGPWEVYRVIMNLIPLNKLCRNLVGDVCTLPTWGGMHPYLLEDGEVALLSSEDIRCFFYLFKTPPEWRKYMAFNREVPPEVVPPALKGKKCVLTAAVLPMGFLNSVTIAQHIHRKIASDALLSPPINWGPEREIRRDRPFSQAKELYRVYLDNFDMLCKVQQPLAERVAGTVAKEVQAVRTEYHRLGLPIHPKKAVMQQTVGDIQGAIFDGVKGKAFPKPEKIRKYVALTLCLLREGRASLKQVQIVCGGLVYLSLFRRPLLGALNSVWRLMGELKALPPVIKLPLPSCVKLELVRFLCLIPLAHMDFRSPYLGEVTASDGWILQQQRTYPRRSPCSFVLRPR